jgi:hypothetical protein
VSDSAPPIVSNDPISALAGDPSGEPPPPEPPKSVPAKAWRWIKWRGAQPVHLVDYELQQTRIRTIFLRVLGALLIACFVAGVAIGAVAVQIALDVVKAGTSTEFDHALKLSGILAGLSAALCVGSVLFLGRASHPPKAKSDEPNPWDAFPSAIVETLKETAKAIRNK